MVSKGVEKRLQEIRESASKSSELVREISAASNEQSKGVDEVNNAVSQLDQVTQSNAAAAEESAASAEELLSQSRTIQSVVKDLSEIVFGSKVSEQRNSGVRGVDVNTQKSNPPSQNVTSERSNKTTKVKSFLAEKKREAEALIPLDDGDFGSF